MQNSLNLKNLIKSGESKTLDNKEGDTLTEKQREDIGKWLLVYKNAN